jgi:hypothetical protein
MTMRSARDIAARAVCLGVIEFRSRFEGVRFAGDAAATREAAEMIGGVTSWLFDAGLEPTLLEAERRLLAEEPNGWERDVLKAVAQAMLPESIAVLLSGINLVMQIPPYDARTDADPLLHLLPFLSDSPFVTRPGMPPREEWEAMAAQVGAADAATVARAEKIAGAWWWRATSESLVRAGKLARDRLDAILRDGEANARALGIPILRGDFVAFGRPYAALTPLLQQAVATLTEARVRGLRWMMSDAAWDAVAMDA